LLYIVVVVSALLLVVTNLIVYRARKPVGKTARFWAAMALGPFFLACVMPLVAIQVLLLAVATIIWRNSGRGPSYFLRLSCGATLIAYVMAGWLVWKSETEFARLRRFYPFVSMEARVPLIRRGPSQKSITVATAERLGRVEQRIQTDWSWLREIQLRIIHELAVMHFIDNPGFGNARMVRRPDDWVLASPLGQKPPPLQPGPRVTSTWSPGELERPPASDIPFLGSIYEDSVSDFVFAAGFGYVKDRRHVAGFLPHQFREVPSLTAGTERQNNIDLSSGIANAAHRWKVRTLDLVGLLLHDAPVVYVSNELPRMDKLRGAPTRPLDKFETLGLSVLHRGEDLFTSRDGKNLRMLGAIYSTRQCVTCHGCERGDLLGAFSYTLERDEP
jgi:hypothetical protein